MHSREQYEELQTESDMRDLQARYDQLREDYDNMERNMEADCEAELEDQHADYGVEIRDLVDEIEDLERQLCECTNEVSRKLVTFD